MKNMAADFDKKFLLLNLLKFGVSFSKFEDLLETAIQTIKASIAN